MVALLAMLAPFTIDTYLPSFPDIARELAASPLVLQQTLSLYLLAFGAMMLVYGPLSDAYGRRRVILVALVVYLVSSVTCALATSAEWLLAARVGQGLSASAGFVIGRAVIRDAFAGAQAQRALSHVMLMFGVGPAFAPIIGGLLHDWWGWRSVFWFLSALGLVVWAIALRGLPETLPRVGRQSADPRVIARAYLHALTNVRFVLLVSVTFLNFGGFFLYIAGSPVVLYEHLGMGSDQFGWLFVPLVGGMMVGAYFSGRVSGIWEPSRTVAAGFALTLFAAAANALLAWLAPPQLVLVVLPVMLYACGMSLAMPSVTLAALDLYPAHRGLASAVQGGMQTTFNAAVAGILAPLLATRLSHLAFGMMALTATSALLWLGWRRMQLSGTVPAP